MVRLRFVDAHVHLWDHAVDGLRWQWLEPDFEHPRLGRLKELDAPRYDVREFAGEVAGATSIAVDKIVHVQAATDGLARETAWLQAMADDHGWPNAIVGGCRLSAANVVEVLAAHAEYANFRGVRDMTAGADLGRPEFEKGYTAVGRFGGVVEVMVSWEQFDDLAAIARAHPDVVLIVGHAGLPVERSAAYRAQWQAGLRRIAAVPTAVCKISALAGADPNWTVASFRPWVLGCIDAFGPRRCMFASNWPVDKLFTTYDRLLGAYSEIVAGCTAEERAALFSGTAERVFRI